MPLQEQNISYKFAGGVETKMDSKAVPAARLLALENGVFSRAISIKKRNGYAPRSRVIDGATSLIRGAQRLAKRDDELLLFTANRCYSNQSVADQWTDAGALLAPVGSDRAAVHTSTAQTMPDRATNGGVTAYAWEDSLGGVWWTVIDEANGRVYRAPTQANAAGQRPRCVPVGDAIHIYYAVPAAHQINVIIVNPASPSAAVSELIVISDLDGTNPVYDAVPTTRTGTPALVVWQEATTTSLRTGYITAGGALGSPGTGCPSVAELAVSLVSDSPVACAYKYVDGADGDRIVLAYMTSTTGIVHVLNGGTVAIPVGATTSAQHIAYAVAAHVTRIALTEADGVAWVVFEETAAAPSERYSVVNSVTVGGAIGSEHTIRSLGLAARAFRISGPTVTAVAATLVLTDGTDLLVLTARTTGTGGNALDIAIGNLIPDVPSAPHYSESGNHATISNYTPGFGTTFSGLAAVINASTLFSAVVVGTGTHSADSLWGTYAGAGAQALTGGVDGTSNADAFAVFVHDTMFFNTYVTLRLSDFAPTGRHLPGSACGPTRTHLASVYVADDVATLVLPYKARLASANNDKFSESALRKITMDFDNDSSHQTAQFGRGLYLGAACPQHYDGRLWTEQGFHVGPELIADVVASGGSMTVASTYEYKVWYEWTDGLGEVHRGPESIGHVVTTGGSDTQATLTLPTLRVTRKSNVRICVARSRPGDTSEFFRVSSSDPTVSGANGFIANDATIDSVSFLDKMSDANLILQEPMYTIGGILSNDPCPLGAHVTAGKNRLFFTDAEAGSVVRFSKRIATGFGAECAPELQQDIDPFGGDVTALATMDDVVYVFKASAIFAFNGDGPFEDGTDTSGGTVSGFSSPQIITSDVGCTDPSSIVLMPQGLMFKSAKGIYQLSRSREVTYVGSPVEAYNSQNVRRAVVLPDRTAVLFLTDSGVSLYYDYLFQQWSTFTNHEGYDAAVVNNTFHYLRTNDVVFRETPGVYTDGGARITLRFETAWLHLHEHLQGFQRFWKLLLLGTWASPHQLGVSHRLDYDEAWSEPYYLDATGGTDPAGWLSGDSVNAVGTDPLAGSNYGDGNYGDGVYGGTGPDVYQWRYGIYEAGEAIQFRFEDFEKAGLAGASFELTEMTIVGGIMKPDIRPFGGARST